VLTTCMGLDSLRTGMLPMNFRKMDMILMRKKMFQMDKFTIKILNKSHHPTKTTTKRIMVSMMNLYLSNHPIHSRLKLLPGNFHSMAWAIHPKRTRIDQLENWKGRKRTRIMRSIIKIKILLLRKSCSENTLTEQIKRTDYRALSSA